MKIKTLFCSILLTLANYSFGQYSSELQYALVKVEVSDEPTIPGPLSVQVEYFYNKKGQIIEMHFLDSEFRTLYTYSEGKIDYAVNAYENGNQDTLFHKYSKDTDTLYVVNSLHEPQFTAVLDEEGRHIERRSELLFSSAVTMSYKDGKRIEESYEPIYGGKVIEVYDEEYDHIIRTELDVFTEEVNENGELIFETQIMEWTYNITFDDFDNWIKIVKLYEGEPVEIKTRDILYW